MNLLESIIGGTFIAIVSCMTGIIFGIRGKITRSEFEDHKVSMTPHISCPVHDKQLDAIEKKLDSMDVKLDTIISHKKI